MLQLLAARLLLSDGWPLNKIAEQFAVISDVQLEKLITGEPNHQTTINGGASATNRHGNSVFTAGMITSLPRLPTPEHVGSQAGSASFLEHASQASVARSEMKAARQQLSLEAHMPRPRPMIRFEIAPWCHLTIEKDHLLRLSVEDVNNLGRAASGAIVSFLTKDRT
jgi:hypothetical protein